MLETPGFWTLVVLIAGFTLQQVTRLIDRHDGAERAKDLREAVILEATRIAELHRMREEVEAAHAALSHNEILAAVAANTAVTQQTSIDAKAAYHEANNANIKISDTNTAIVTLQGQVQQTLAIAEGAQAAGDSSPVLKLPNEGA